MTKTELFTEYAAYHADRRNRICHAFGIPLIVLGIMGSWTPRGRLGPVDLAMRRPPIAVLIYYAAIDPRGALISAVVFALLYLVAIRLSGKSTWRHSSSDGVSNSSVTSSKAPNRSFRRISSIS